MRWGLAGIEPTPARPNGAGYARLNLSATAGIVDVNTCIYNMFLVYTGIYTYIQVYTNYNLYIQVYTKIIILIHGVRIPDVTQRCRSFLWGWGWTEWHESESHNSAQARSRRHWQWHNSSCPGHARCQALHCFTRWWPLNLK